MGRAKRTSLGGLVYHVLNRANGKRRIFHKPEDYEAFERVLALSGERTSMRLLAYCLMPNHWHLMLWPRQDGDLSRFMAHLTLTHTQRWHAHNGTAGAGHLYQGRFKSFIVQSDAHLLIVCRYVERNALRAGLVERAEDWRWGSLWHRCSGREHLPVLLDDGPLQLPGDWVATVNGLEDGRELRTIRRCVTRGVPYGEPDWVLTQVKTHGLESTLRHRGRPIREKGS